jgi:hypothetical protein
MLATLITRDWKQVLRNYLVANLQYYSMKKAKSRNLGGGKKVEKNAYKIIGIHKYKSIILRDFWE